MKKDRQFVSQPFYPPMEVGRFGKAPAEETNFFGAKTRKKQHHAQCEECDGTGKIAIYPLVDISCQVCKGKGYLLELHKRFEISFEI
jgi:hypothetical protein